MSRKMIVIWGLGIGFALRAIFGDPNALQEPAKPSEAKQPSEDDNDSSEKPADNDEDS